MTIQPPVKDEPAEAFETPAARDERLVRKHLSAFDRFFLNRVTPFGVSMVQRAQQAEAIEHSGMELNAIAELVEGNESDKGKTEENRRLREAYYDTYIARPK